MPAQDEGSMRVVGDDVLAPCQREQARLRLTHGKTG
jgi:hypothetical protein